MEHIAVKFGTTAEDLHRAIHRVAQKNGWDPKRVRYVIDMEHSTVKDTVYAVSDRPEGLPLHPSGPGAIQRLVT